MKKLVCFVLMLAVTSSLSYCAVLLANDEMGTSSFNSAGHWDNGLAPSADNTYVTQGYLLRTPSTAGSYTFAGNSLIVGQGNGGGANPFLTDGSVNNNCLLNKTPGNPVITVNNLILDAGTVRDGMGSTDTWTLDGVIEVSPNGGGLAAQCRFDIDSIINGSGPLYIATNGNGDAARTIYINNPNNSYNGSITLLGVDAAHCRLAFSEGSRMNFVIGTNGVNNSISGTGTAVFNGTFYFDLAAAAVDLGSSWTIANVTSQSFGSNFSVAGFTDMGSGYWTTITNGVTYQFNENTGTLMVTYPGLGTAEHPYEIRTPQQMNTLGTLASFWNKSFKLMADIDMSAYTGTQYNIIGNETTPFTGTFDGNGHVISNLFWFGYSRTYDLGMFGCIAGASICNLDLSNVTMSGITTRVGGLVGYNLLGTITNCSMTGSVIGKQKFGGLVGDNEGTITNCSASGSVSGDYIPNTQITGGLAGDNSGTITNCYSTCSVYSSAHVGGLVGYNSGSITNCYSQGSVSIPAGGYNYGGLAGVNESPGLLTACFWDTQTSGQSSGVGYGTSTGSFGKTTAQMKTLSTFTSAGWDFSDTDGDPADWSTAYRDYPRLFWRYPYMCGSGTSQNPWQIRTARDMNTIGVNPDDWASCFKLTDDIDMSAYTGTQYNIIGNTTAKFTGTFDGDGHVISNLSYTTTASQNYVGLFGFVLGGTIRNLKLENVTVSSAGNFVGALAGDNEGTIINCCAAGSVQGSYYVGGLVGDSFNAGDPLKGIITACYADCTVSGTNSIGGLAGYTNLSILTNCRATGSVSGTAYIGGLAGYVNASTFTNCYAAGSVSGSSNKGGLGGYNQNSTFVACFWDTQTSGQSTGFGNGNVTGVVGKTTEQMKTLSTFTDAGWDFSDTDGDPAEWSTAYRDYPQLFWQFPHTSGNGTSLDPWQIWTAKQINTIGLNPEDWAGCFILMADIDMGAYTGTQYNIIGNTTTKFTGTFDGNGHIISNLAIDASTQDYVGLFGYVGSGGQIRYMGMENVNITGRNYVGGLIGMNSGTLTACYATGSVSGSYSVGSLVGFNYYDTLTACYATGSVSGSYSVGSLVGRNYYGTLTACYATGTVSGSYYVGGMVGYDVFGMITACFWDTQTSGQSNGVGEGSSSGILGKTTAEMKLLSTFTDAGWDFTNETSNGMNNIWRMCADGVDYPRLNWESMASDMACPDGVHIEDFSDLAAWWMADNCTSSNNDCGWTDLNHSGSVDVEDFAIFAADWLEGI